MESNATVPVAPSKLTFVKAAKTSEPLAFSPAECIAAASATMQSYAKPAMTNGLELNTSGDAVRSNRSFAQSASVEAVHALDKRLYPSEPSAEA